MDESGRAKLGRIADKLGIPYSEAQSWVVKLCSEPAVEIHMVGPVEGGEIEVRQSGESTLQYDDVVRVAEAVIAGESNMSLSRIREITDLSEQDLRAVCAKSLAKRFDLDDAIVARSLEAIEFSSECVFVGAARRDSDGRLVFRSGAEKRQAKALFKAFMSAAEGIRGRLQPFVDDPDPAAGLPILDLRVSSAAWLGEIPRQVYEPLIRWASGGDLDQLMSDVEGARVGLHDEHRKNVAILVNQVFQLSGKERKTRHDVRSTPFMDFAETVGRLYGVKLNPGLLEATRDQQWLLGVPGIRYENHRS